jgi:hypothetical protein
LRGGDLRGGGLRTAEMVAMALSRYRGQEHIMVSQTPAPEGSRLAVSDPTPFGGQ